MRIQLRKIILLASVVFNLMLAYFIWQISNLVYRYNRMDVWTGDNIQLLIVLKDKILWVWIIWGILFLLSIIILVLEFKKNKTNNIK